MAVHVRLLASLRERLGFDTRDIEARDGLTARDAWLAATGGAALPSQVRIAVNADYADSTTPLRDGDEVAFFPPVTGG